MTLDRTGSSILPQQESVRYGWRSPNLGHSPACNGLGQPYATQGHPCLISKVGQRAAYLFCSPGRSDVRGRLHSTLLLLEMKNHVCQWPNCRKSFTRAEHLRRHSLNHEQSREGYTCERCFVHFNRPDLLCRFPTTGPDGEDADGGSSQTYDATRQTRRRSRRSWDGSPRNTQEDSPGWRWIHYHSTAQATVPATVLGIHDGIVCVGDQRTGSGPDFPGSGRPDTAWGPRITSGVGQRPTVAVFRRP